jgi:hypothetical protein
LRNERVEEERLKAELLKLRGIGANDSVFEKVLGCIFREGDEY